VSSIAARLYATAEVATRAAVHRQHADLDGAVHDGTIDRLQSVADWLWAAAKNFESPPVASRRQLTASSLMFAVMTVASVAILLAVPHPAEPWVLALTFGGAQILARLVVSPIFSALDRRAARYAATDPGDIEDVFADLRSRIAAVAVDLDPVRHDSHLRAGQEIERALAWLD
jgi:hypothetical protein